MHRGTPHTHHAYRRYQPHLRLARPARQLVPVQVQAWGSGRPRVQEWAVVCELLIPTRIPTLTRVPNRLVADRQTSLLQAQQVYEEPERVIQAMIHPDEPSSGDTKMRGE
jgi:transposase InsO family protein